MYLAVHIWPQKHLEMMKVKTVILICCFLSGSEHESGALGQPLTSSPEYYRGVMQGAKHPTVAPGCSQLLPIWQCPCEVPLLAGFCIYPGTSQQIFQETTWSGCTAFKCWHLHRTSRQAVCKSLLAAKNTHLLYIHRFADLIVWQLPPRP